MVHNRDSLKFMQFGSDKGRTVVFFHGAPGAPEECGIFDLEGKNHDLKFVCLDRFSADPTIDGEAYYKFLATEISKISYGTQVDIVGFSIGAFIALQTVRYMADGARSLHLVSLRLRHSKQAIILKPCLASGSLS